MTTARNRRTNLAHRSNGSIMRGVATSAVGTFALDASLYRGYRDNETRKESP